MKKLEWPKKTISEICQIRGGGTPSKAVKRYWEGRIPWVSPKDMKSEIVADSIDHISMEAIENSAASMIPKGSVLIVVRSGILARIVPISIAGCDLTINQDLKALCPTNDSLLPRYLYYVLQSQMESLLKHVSRGATVHRLPTEKISKLSLFIPSLEEQKGIVAILDDALEALDVAEQTSLRKIKALAALRATLLQEQLNPS